jgi:hypothetical protein
MITNAGFKGDMAAIKLEASRGDELRNLTDLLSAEEVEELHRAEERLRQKAERREVIRLQLSQRGINF